MTTKELQSISCIIDVKQVKLTKEIESRLGKSLFLEAKKNSKKINAYYFTYRSKNRKIKGVLVEPKKKGPHPCIIFNRGGSKDFGAIKLGSLFLSKSYHGKLSLENYIVISTQYPGAAGGEGEDKFGSKDDIASILDLKKILMHYTRADAKRMGMVGHSRGGLMTYMCLREITYLKAAVVVASVADEVNAHKFRKEWAAHQKKMYGGSLAEKKRRSPVLWANELPKKTPILIMHGTSDWRVNPETSLHMAQELYKNKIPYRFIMYEGADHAISEYKREYMNEIVHWLNRYVRDEEKSPNLNSHGN